MRNLVLHNSSSSLRQDTELYGPLSALTEKVFSVCPPLQECTYLQYIYGDREIRGFKIPSFL